MTSQGLNHAELYAACGVPQTRKKEVDVVNIGDLFHKRWDALDESLAVMLYEDVQVNAMLPARGERLCVVPTVALTNQWSSGLVSSVPLPLDILPNDLHNQRSRVDGLQITPRHLQYEAHRAWDDSDDSRASLHLSRLELRKGWFRGL